MNFQITEEEHKKINDWLEKEVDPEILEKQKDFKPSMFLMEGEVYSGAIGGRLTYYFTPVSLGLAFKVKDNISGKELNLTDYDSW